jgi:phosphoglycerate dehydrogenase-like enzyme
MKQPSPATLILASDAEEYLPFLQDLAERGVDMSIAETADVARNVYSGQPVVLGQPDLVAAVLSELPGVRWVQSSWAGVTPLLELGRSNYVLTGVKDTFGPQMAEYVFAYLLANELKLFERLGQQADRIWWEQPSGSLSGKTLGIMGTGSIGRHIAQTALAFGMRVAGYSRGGVAAEGFEKVFSGNQLADFLAAPDYIVCVLPDTPATKHLLDASAFRAMKNHCCLVNVGRGNVIDEKALLEALSEGELSTAVLDVFQDEPLPENSPLWNVPGLIVTAHIAARSEPRDIAGIFRENYRRYVAGEPLKYRIDFERGY